MNTKDIKTKKRDKSSQDRLGEMFAAQNALMMGYKPIAEAHYSKIFGQEIKIEKGVFEGGEHNLHTRRGSFMIRDMINACCQELNEAIQANKNWKAWKQTEVQTDVEHFKEEMIDAWHFYMEACILAGITADDLYNIYFKKHEVNKFRQRSKY